MSALSSDSAHENLRNCEREIEDALAAGDFRYHLHASVTLADAKQTYDQEARQLLEALQEGRINEAAYLCGLDDIGERIKARHRIQQPEGEAVSLEHVEAESEIQRPLNALLEERREHWLLRLSALRPKVDATVAEPIDHRSPSVIPPSPQLSAGDASVAEHDTSRTKCWGDIKIVLLGDYRLQVTVGDALPEVLNYWDVRGFQDARANSRSRSWLLLQVLGKCGGIIPEDATPREKSRRIAFQKAVERVRKALKGYFGLTDNPLCHVRGVGYCAQFSITAAKSDGSAAQN